MKLIDKDKIAAEIEKEVKNIYAGREYVGIHYDEECMVRGLQKAEDIIDTLEVKEVDLEKEKKPFKETPFQVYKKKPFFVITNTKTGNHFLAEKLRINLENHTIIITPQNMNDTVRVVGKPLCLNDVLTKKELIGDNETLHIEKFNVDNVMQSENFIYNAWIQSADYEVNEMILCCEHII